VGMGLTRIAQLRSTESARRNPLRSKVDGFLPLTRYRSTVLGEDTKPHGNDVRECKMTLKLPIRTPSLIQDSARSRRFPFAAESMFNRIKFGISRLERRKTERRAK